MNKAIRLTKSFTALLLTAIITLGTFAVTANAAELKSMDASKSAKFDTAKLYYIYLNLPDKDTDKRLPATSSVGTSTVQDMEQM